jgi:hypothetical protein
VHKSEYRRDALLQELQELVEELPQACWPLRPDRVGRHVRACGVNHYATYFRNIGQLLADDTVALIHTVGRSEPPTATHPFIAKYIFPGGYIPALSEIVPRGDAFRGVSGILLGSRGCRTKLALKAGLVRAFPATPEGTATCRNVETLGSEYAQY